MKVIIKKSTNPNKKLMAIFYDNYGNKIKTTHFGASSYSDYTIHKSDERKNRYLNRHRANENWDEYWTAGALSRWILWNKKTLEASIQDYKNRFNLD